jgi:hypothetical protein
MLGRNGRRKKFVVGVTVLLFSGALSAHAQFDGALSDPLVLRFVPEYPSAYTQVTAELKSFSVDINRATISWSLDGVSQVTDERNFFDFSTKGFGVPTTLGVVVVTEDGRTFTKTRTFEPAGVEVLWQARSYTPPFYKGKAMFPFEGGGTIVAVPFFQDLEGSYIPAHKLIYTWQKDGENIEGASGLGKNTLAVRSRIPVRSATYSVVAESEDRRLAGVGETTLNPIAPQLIFYEDNPRLGFNFAHAVGESVSLDDEMRLSVMPYFFEIDRRASPDIRYTWKLNHEPSPSETKSDIVLRRPGPERGEAIVGLRALIPNRSLQYDDESFLVRVEEAAGAFGDVTSPQP